MRSNIAVSCLLWVGANEGLIKALPRGSAHTWYTAKARDEVCVYFRLITPRADSESVFKIGKR
jgi:hypothetical protein